jgi:hypothetical protein
MPLQERLSLANLHCPSLIFKVYAVLIYGLFLAPDFTPEMERGIEPPPYVDHDSIDWLALGRSLSNHFEFSKHGVTLRLADDTVDQVTIQMREFGVIQGPIDCKDFAEALLGKAEQTDDNPVPIQDAWRSLHHLNDRANAPPPVMMPLILEGDHDDVRELVYTMMLRLRVKAAQHPEKLFSGEKLPEDFYQGYLPDSVRDLFASHFGIGYKPYATLISLNADRPG